MHRIEIPEKNILVELPSSWEECTTEQAQYILEHAFDVMEGQEDIYAFRLRIFKKFSGLRFGIGYLVRKKLGLVDELHERLHMLAEQTCAWPFRKIGEVYELNFDSYINHIPVLDNKYGPADLLQDVTLGEFKTANTIMQEYFRCKDNQQEADNLLNLFIAQLYRPLGEDGKRLKFHQYHPQSADFEQIPAWQKHVILIWWTNCVKILQTQELTINGIDVDLSVLFPSGGSGQSKYVNLGWQGIMLDIAEAGVFGDAAQTSQTELYEILLFLFKKYQDNKKATKK